MNDTLPPRNAEAKDDKLPNEFKLEEHVRKIAEFGALFIASVYILGFIIVNTHLLKYGISAFSVIKYEYVVAGVAYILCVASVAVPSWLLLRWFTSNWPIVITKANILGWLCRLIVFVSISLIPCVLMLHLFFPAKSHDWEEYRPLLIYLLLDAGLIFIFLRLMHISQKISKIVGIGITTMLSIIGLPIVVYVWHKYIYFKVGDGIAFLILVLFTVYLAYRVYHVRKMPNGDVVKENVKVWVTLVGTYYIMALSLLTAFGFGLGLYGQISMVSGGARAIKVVVYIKSHEGDALTSEKTPKQSNEIEGIVIERTDKALFLKDASGYITEFPLENIEKMRILDPNQNNIPRS
jgi:hypothetical protein